MNFFSDENRNNYNFNKNLDYFKNQNQTPKKQYRWTCPLFSKIGECCSSCNLNCCSNCSFPSCNCSCSNIRTFINKRPYCFATIVVGILLFIIILIIIIAVSVKKKNKDDKEDEAQLQLEVNEIYNSIGDKDKGTLAEFCNYLSSTASDLKESQKVNLAYKWITQNIQYDTEGVAAKTEERDPDKFFGSKKTVCSGYAHLLYRLLTAMNYNPDNIKNITGYAKGQGYSVYNEPKVDHEWNAIKIDGKWCLVDATWDAGLNESEYAYFCTRPECFVRDHLPEISENQFLDKPIDLNTFHNYLWTTGSFCQFNAKIVEDKSYYNQCSGKFTVTYDIDYDTELEIYPKNDVTFEKKKINNGFEVNFSAKGKGKFELIMFLFDENLNGLKIGTINLNCE